MANTTYGHFNLGLTDVKITKIDGSAQEDLDAAQELTVSVTISESVLEGDDVEKASVVKIRGGSGRAGAGSMSIGATAIVLGATPSTSGTTPNRVTTTKITSALKPPYFKIYGMAYDDTLGALQVIVHKAKISGDIEFALQSGDNNWVTPGWDFRCLANDSGDIIDLIQLETAAALPAS